MELFGGGIRRCGLVKGLLSLGVGFEFPETCSIPIIIAVPSRSELSALSEACLCSALVDSNPLKVEAQLNPFFVSCLDLVFFVTAIEK